MEFDYDPDKSESNRQKHGIDFVETQTLWQDPRHIIVPARTTPEPRFALIATRKRKVWTCIFTIRDSKVRIISTRSARDGEEEGYYHR